MRDVGETGAKGQGDDTTELFSVEITTFEKDGGDITKLIIRVPDAYAVTSDGSLCVMPRGKAGRTPLTSMADFAAHITGLPGNKAIAPGRLVLSVPDNVMVVTKKRLAAHPGAIARTRAYIDYEPGKAAFALIDFDQKQMPPHVKQKIDDMGGLVAAIASIIDLRGIGRLVRASTSAALSVDGVPIEGSGGSHLYLRVTDGADIERALKALHEACWLAGLGWFMVGRAGQALERSIVDRSVWAPERLIFEAAPRLGPGVTQDAKAREPIFSEGGALDTAVEIRDVGPNRNGELAALKKAAREAVKGEMARVRTIWTAEYVDRLKQRNMTEAAARRVVEAALRLDGGALLPGFELLFEDETITVGDILADPESFLDRWMFDPLEGPEYGHLTACVQVRDDGSVWVWSFAHGGVAYQLKHDPETLMKSVDGMTGDAAFETFIRNLNNTETAGLAEWKSLRQAFKQRLGYDRKGMHRDFDTIWSATETKERLRILAARARDDIGLEGERLDAYRLNGGGYYRVTANGAAIWLASPFAHDGMAVDGKGETSVAISWPDHAGIKRRGTIPRRMSSRSFNETCDTLTARELDIAVNGTAREMLAEMIVGLRSQVRLVMTERPGWVMTEAGRAYVIRNGEAIGPGANLVYPSIELLRNRAFDAVGTLDEWKQHVARPAAGNTRLMLAIATALAGPVMRLLNRESFIIHFYFDSRSGKTTALRMAASVYGRAEEGAAFGSWNTTANAIEGTAMGSNDGLWGIDELSRARRGVPSEVAYTFASGAGKNRMTSNITARDLLTWLSIGMSTGERSLAEQLLTDGYQLMAGQEVRFISVPSDAGEGMGILEQLHEYPDGASFVDEMKVLTRQYHGTAIRAFVLCLIADLERDEAALLAWFKDEIDTFVERMGPTLSAQARAVASNFGLIAAVGKLAARYGVVPWEEGAMDYAALLCFAAWGSARDAGFTEQAEDVAIEAKVREALRAGQYGNFLDLRAERREYLDEGKWGVMEVGDGRTLEDTRRTVKHWGYREETKEGPLFWTHAGALVEICQTTDQGVARVARVLRERGWLVVTEADQGMTHTRRLRLKGGQMRMYCIKGAIFAGEAPEIDEVETAPEPEKKARKPRKPRKTTK